jgi:hypothetical protein
MSHSAKKIGHLLTMCVLSMSIFDDVAVTLILGQARLTRSPLVVSVEMYQDRRKFFKTNR